MGFLRDVAEGFMGKPANGVQGGAVQGGSEKGTGVPSEGLLGLGDPVLVGKNVGTLPGRWVPPQGVEWRVGLVDPATGSPVRVRTSRNTVALAVGERLGWAVSSVTWVDDGEMGVAKHLCMWPLGVRRLECESLSFRDSEGYVTPVRYWWCGGCGKLMIAKIAV